jgi:hypothetical protein
MIDFVNLKIKSVQSFRDAHRGRMYVCVHKGERLYVKEYLCLYCIFFKKKANRSFKSIRRLYNTSLLFVVTGDYTSSSGMNCAMTVSSNLLEVRPLIGTRVEPKFSPWARPAQMIKLPQVANQHIRFCWRAAALQLTCRGGPAADRQRGKRDGIKARHGRATADRFHR